MSLNRISFLEGWERNPAAFLRGREEPSDSDDEAYHDLPEPSLSSSFPSTYSRLNFNPYAGPAWNEGADDRDDRPSLFGYLGLSPTTTRDSPVNERRTSSPIPGHAHLCAESTTGGPSKEPGWLSDTRGAYEVRPTRRVGMPRLSLISRQGDANTPPVQVCLAVVYCFLAAGVVFGFAALKPVLIREKVYRNLCSPAELEEDVAVCDGQEIR